MIKRIRLLSLVVAVFAIINIGYSQQVNVWKINSTINSSNRNINFHNQTLYELDIKTLKATLVKTPKRNAKQRSSKVLLDFPMSDGTLEVFEVFEHSVLSEELAAKYPSIKSYYARSVINPLNTIRFSLDDLGFYGMVFFKGETTYINPLENTKKVYSFTDKKDYKARSFKCLFEEDEVNNNNQNKTAAQLRTVDDGILRTFRLALACTGEYATFHINAAGVAGGTDMQKKAAVLSAMNVTMTRVNGIYERDLSITMEIIPNNDEIIFLDSATDGYTNNDTFEMLDENQEIIDNIIGTANYDIGHVFSTAAFDGFGIGVATFTSACLSTFKAGGVTGLNAPVGDVFNVDFVTHEMGHQYGALHTQNNNCSRNNGTAVEPGSGSTIMGYAGICAPNVQSNSDAYFHAISIEQIWNNITSGNSTCAATQSLANTEPVVSGGSDHTIPAGTPFVLEASASDIDGDILTYCWEQIDNQIGVMPPVSDATGGPIFRSRPPSNLPTRYFPQTQDLLNNDLSPMWEVIPTVSRNMNFSILVRDNNLIGGQTARDDVQIVVDDSSGPFAVTSHSTTETLNAGEITTVMWDVSGTNLPPINTSLVDIYLVVDDDFENLVLLNQNVVNDGSHPVSIPSGITTSMARIMVKAVDNVFFAINSEYLTIQQSEFVLNFDATEYAVCQPDDLIFNFVYNTFVGFSEDVTLTATNVPAGLNVSFNPNIVSVDDTTVEVTVTGTNAMSIGNTSITIVGTSVSLTKNYPIGISILSPTVTSPNLLLPSHNSIDISLDQILSWESDVNAQQYELEISEQSSFSTIAESYIGSLTGFLPTILQSNTQYFWRVKSINICGESIFSSPFTFTTARINCNNEFFNTDIVPIDSEGFNMVTSSINVSDAGLLDDLTVSVNISHTYVSDLTLSLTSPMGTTIILVSEACEAGEDIDVIFSDTGQSLICEINPSISSIITPTQQLSTFKEEQISGTWTLTVVDNFNGDGGSINSFGLDICAKDYYTVTIADESCRELNDGTIIISTEDSSNHTVTLSGANTNTSIPFTTNSSFTGLAAGNYTVCISRDNILNSEQCFDIIINEPELFDVQTQLNSDTKTVDINLSGASTYTIELNGEVSQVSESNTTLQLANGYNSLLISTGINCNEPYSEIFIVGDKNVVYPSPFESELTLFVTEDDKLVHITIHSVNGKLIMNEDLRSNERGEIILQLAQLSSGIYIVNIKADGVNNVHKIVKQ